MTENQPPQAATGKLDEMAQHLAYLKLPFTAEQYGPLAQQAAQKQLAHVDDLATLVQGEVDLKRDRATQNRIRQARFPVITTLDLCRFDWPTRMNQLPGQNHFRLDLDPI